MIRQRRRPRNGYSSRRGGAAALFVLVCLSFATVVGTLLMQAGLAERTSATRLELAHQADWLAEAGIERAAAELDRSSRYTGETWPIPAAEIDASHSAVVQIAVNRDQKSKFRLIHVTARLQIAAGTAVEATKEVRMAVGADES